MHLSLATCAFLASMTANHCANTFLLSHPRQRSNRLEAKPRETLFEKNLRMMAEQRRSAKEGKVEPKAKSRYVPPELSNCTLDITAEQRIIFEARRDGNRWKQNEILNKHLGS